MTTTLPPSPPDDLHAAIFTARDAARAARIVAVDICDTAAVLAADAEADPEDVAAAQAAARAATAAWRTAIAVQAAAEAEYRDARNERIDAEVALLGMFSEEASA